MAYLTYREIFDKLLEEHAKLFVKVDEKDEEKTRVITKLQNYLNVIHDMEKYVIYVDEICGKLFSLVKII